MKHRAFHSYTMKQAIQEGFILDVLSRYTPVQSYYRLAKTIEDDPEFDTKKAQKKLQRFVEGHDHAIRLKAEIMVDHFHDQVLVQGKIGGEARAMVVTNGVERAIQYFHAIRGYLSDFYRATILADETDPNKLHDLQAELDAAEVYASGQIDTFVGRYLEGAERDQLDPILDSCVEVYRNDLDEDAQVAFKGKAKAFVRTYGFLSSILPYTNAGWEKRSIFLNFLIPKLPAPPDEDLSKGILDAIDMDSYRVEKRAMQTIVLPDEDAEIGPVPTEEGGGRPESELDRLSNIIATFNDLFGDIAWEDSHRVRRLITEEIPSRVAVDTAFRNARENSDKENARIEHDRALLRVMTGVMKDDTELFKQFVDNEGFKRWMSDTVFGLAYDRPAAP